MKEFFMIFFQLLPFVLFANQNVTFHFVPNESKYSLSVEHVSENAFWQTGISFSGKDGYSITLPVTGSLQTGNGVFSFGGNALWKHSTFCTFLDGHPSVTFSDGTYAVSYTDSMFSVKGPRAFGVELPLGKASFSLLHWAWGASQIANEYHYLTTWDEQKATGGWGGRMSLHQGKGEASVEWIYTDVCGLHASIQQKLEFPAVQLSVSYGDKTYPKSFKVELNHERSNLVASYSLESKYGSLPVFGGESQIQKTTIHARLRKEEGPWFLDISSLAEKAAKKDGSLQNQYDLQLSAGNQDPSLAFVASVKVKRRQPPERSLEWEASVGMADVLLTYRDKAFCFSLSHEFPVSQGKIGFLITQRQGDGSKLSVSYATTIDR